MNLQEIIDRFIEKKVFLADYGDVEQLIKEFYGFDEYSIPCQEVCANDVSLKYNLNGVISDWENEQLIKVLKTKMPSMFSTQLYLNNMVSVGILPKGEYVIEVSW